MVPPEIESESFRLVGPPRNPVGIIPYYILHDHACVKDQLFVRYAVTDNTANVRNLAYYNVLSDLHIPKGNWMCKYSFTKL
jgi:hypothetical protein